MSSGRQIFRFMKFVEDLGKLYEKLQKPLSFNIILQSCVIVAGLFYHVFDSIVWMSDIGLIGKYIFEKVKWKNSKDFSALWRSIIKIVLCSIDLKDLYYDYKQTSEEIQLAFSDIIDSDKFKNEINRKLIKHAINISAKIRLQLLNILGSFTKILTSAYSLKIEPYYSNSHPLFISFCGFVHSILSFTKELIKVSDFLNFI